MVLIWRKLTLLFLTVLIWRKLALLFWYEDLVSLPYLSIKALLIMFCVYVLNINLAQKNTLCIFQYLKGTSNLGLWYHKNMYFDLEGYMDVEFSCCCTDRKSTSGTYHFLEYCLVSWFTNKKNLVTLSMQEVVALKSFEWNKLYKFMAFILTNFLYFVII